MSSTIRFKFKAAKDFEVISFNGMGLRVFDLKRRVVEKRQMNKGLDFELQVTNANTSEGENQLETGLSFQTKEPSSFLVVKLAAVPALLNIYPVYSDDNAMVSKNTDVIVKRMPAMRGMGILSRMKNQDSGNAMISSSNLSVPYLSTCLLMKVSFADAQRLAPLYARPSAYFELFVLCIAQALHLIFCVKQKVAL
eukprot:CAMPEP_0194569300 /NCGR_PEP_ID=MMETSP0292-20121207/7072_1 /TAXON_ID=39354 /ORGANISM="Heterosigma akashiwo, Strain CCMP2393" /LENGTH=194 /DNA_ID=CAMNT_0039419525 /DNA_START=231 /DNA_END=816 /DNA_ORIENTATION=-